MLKFWNPKPNFKVWAKARRVKTWDALQVKKKLDLTKKDEVIGKV